ncbi:MAG: hypothetical protein K2W96_08630 [Gemmataceae bacterium]|nr:hypothetical protein [Gemmataceae bacterium]
MPPIANMLDDDTTRKVLAGVIIFLLTTVASFVLGRWWGAYQSAQEWERKQFLGRIIVSLNTFADGFLKIRTVFERSLEEVFINSVAVRKVREAARKTTSDSPLLPIDPKDRWFLLNFVLNAVAEKFALGQVRYDAGQPLTPVAYLLFLTSETVGDDRIRKVRAMLVRKEMLLDLPKEMPKLEQPWHGDRLETLRRAAEAYRREPDNFLMLEVYV